MSEDSKIEWTDSTFNPWIGCTKVGPGCDHCYAEALMDVRHRRVQWGASQPRVRTSADNWNAPRSWNKYQFYECLDCGARFAPRRRNEGFITCPGCSPHKGRKVQDEEDGSRIKQVRRRVFCASLADVFDNEVDPAWREQLFNLIDETPNLDWLLLTKRIGNVARMEPADWAQGNWPKNVWLGATVVNQEEADRDIPKLLAVPARVRFLSIEPMLGPVDLRGQRGNYLCSSHEFAIAVDKAAADGFCTNEEAKSALDRHRRERGGHSLIDWVIAGGESGQGARPMHPDWARSLRDQCEAAGVPFLFKQWGEWGPLEQNRGLGWKMGDERTGFFDDEGWHHMGVSSHGPHMLRVGKKAAGRLLDGRAWDGFPTCAIGKEAA